MAGDNIDVVSILNVLDGQGVFLSALAPVIGDEQQSCTEQSVQRRTQDQADKRVAT
jgi:hypothetical protein